MPGDCPLAAAVRRCPFLSQLGAREGEAFARRVAANPFAPAAGQPPLLEEEGLSGYEATLRLFHGPGGVVPLRRFADAPAPSAASGCPFRAAAAAAAAAPPTAPAGQPASAAQPAGAAARCAVTEAAPPAGSCARALPFASISLSGFGFVVSISFASFGAAPLAVALGFAVQHSTTPRHLHGLLARLNCSLHFASTASRLTAAHRPSARPQPAPLALPSRLQPDPGQFFNRPPRAKKQQQPQQRKPADPGSGRSGSGSGARPGATSGSSPGASSGGSSGSGTGRLRPGHGAGGPAGQFKRVLGGLLPLAAGGHLSCPAPIVKMRAAIAALKPVRDLRPQALPIRCEALGVGMCGWWLRQCRCRGATANVRAPQSSWAAAICSRQHSQRPCAERWPGAPLLIARPACPCCCPSCRALAMSGTAIAAGLPCGMWREHTKKFSPQVRVRRCRPAFGNKALLLSHG